MYPGSGLSVKGSAVPHVPSKHQCFHAQHPEQKTKLYLIPAEIVSDSHLALYGECLLTSFSVKDKPFPYLPTYSLAENGQNYFMYFPLFVCDMSENLSSAVFFHWRCQISYFSSKKEKVSDIRTSSKYFTN